MLLSRCIAAAVLCVPTAYAGQNAEIRYGQLVSASYDHHEEMSLYSGYQVELTSSFCAAKPWACLRSGFSLGSDVIKIRTLVNDANVTTYAHHSANCIVLGFDLNIPAAFATKPLALAPIMRTTFLYGMLATKNSSTLAENNMTIDDAGIASGYEIAVGLRSRIFKRVLIELGLGQRWMDAKLKNSHFDQVTNALYITAGYDLGR